MIKQLIKLEQFLKKVSFLEYLLVANLKKDIEDELNLTSLKDTHLGGAEEKYHQEREEVNSDLMNKIKKSLIGSFHQYKIYFVDGTEIRNNLDEDYIGGGNDARYKYIPKDEIWIDESTSKKDLIPYIVHEISEAEGMKKEDLSYDDAHDIASEIEWKIRHE